jgi:hypothetical protein
MMRMRLLGLTTGMMLGVAGTVASTAAQSPIPVSMNAGISATFPRGALGERWGMGLGFGARAAVQLVPRYTVYAGYSHTFFDLDPYDDLTAVDTGFSAGVARVFPLAGVAWEPWLATGLLLHDLKIEGTVDPQRDGQLGYEVGGGVGVPLRRGFRATYGVGYRRYQARIQRTERETVSYISVEAGFDLSF